MKYIFNKYVVILYIILLITSMLFSPVDTGIHNPIGHGETGDYIMHFLVYLPWMFGGIILRGENFRRNLWFVVGTMFVIALESLQLALPYRGFNIYDLLVGEIGLIFSYIALMLFVRLTNSEAR